MVTVIYKERVCRERWKRLSLYFSVLSVLYCLTSNFEHMACGQGLYRWWHSGLFLFYLLYFSVLKKTPYELALAGARSGEGHLFVGRSDNIWQVSQGLARKWEQLQVLKKEAFYLGNWLHR